MNKDIKKKLLELYSNKLESNMETESVFSVDVEYKTGEHTYFLVSELYCEGVEEIFTDYDQPDEYTLPNIVVNSFGLIKMNNENGDMSHIPDVAEEIIKQAIINYTP